MLMVLFCELCLNQNNYPHVTFIFGTDYKIRAMQMLGHLTEFYLNRLYDFTCSRLIDLFYMIDYVGVGVGVGPIQTKTGAKF